MFGRWKQLFDDPAKTPGQKLLGVGLIEHPAFTLQFAKLIVNYFGDQKLSRDEPVRVEHSCVVEALEGWAGHSKEEMPGGESLTENIARAAKIPASDARVRGSLEHVVTEFSKSCGIRLDDIKRRLGARPPSGPAQK